ncbi:CdaR family protein, partial [Staphylococcus hominis]|nr:CdaR family protein [Staphylococcus hominis]
NNVDSNYKVSETSLNKDTVQVTGGKKQLDKIAYLKATFKNATNISENTTDVAEITAFDKQLNKLNVQIKPNNIKMSVKLEPYSKKVKIKTVKKGSLPDDESLDSIKLNENEVEIYGNKDDLKDINDIEADVNLDDITESTDKTLQLKIPKQVKKSEFNEVTAHVNLK